MKLDKAGLVMKPIILLILIFTSLIAFTQKGQINGQIVKSGSLPYPYFIVSLKQAGSIIQEAVPDAEGRFTLNEVEKGFHSLIVKRPFYGDYIADSLLVVIDKPIYLNIHPCFPTKGKTPKCVGGHTDQIIPIAYGKSTAETMKKAKQGVVRIGGCLVTGCDPNYYCTLHEIEF
jgi:hypothetical protein